MVRKRTEKLSGKEEINHSFWKSEGEKTEKFNYFSGSKGHGRKNFPDRGNLDCSKAKGNDAIKFF